MEGPRWSAAPLVLAVMGLLIVLTGGWVRVSEAGEACPEWPTCFGEIHPFISEQAQEDWWAAHPDEVDSRGPGHRYTTMQIFTEWFHRLLVGTIALPVLFLTIWAVRDSTIFSRRLTGLLLGSSALLAIQALAGYLTVEYDNLPWSVSLHLLLSQTFILMLLAAWLEWTRIDDSRSGRLLVQQGSMSGNRWLWSSAIFVLLVLVAGAMISSSGTWNACSVGFTSAWPFCQGDVIPPLSTNVGWQLVHRVAVILVALNLIVMLSHRSREGFATDQPNVHQMLRLGTGVYIFNVLLAGLFLTLAENSGLVASLSLLHLMAGSLSFLAIGMAATMQTLGPTTAMIATEESEE